MNSNDHYPQHRTNAPTDYGKTTLHYNHINYEYSMVQFNPDRATGIKLLANHISHKAKNLAFTANDILLNCQAGSIEISSHNAIEITADDIEFVTTGGSISISKNEINCDVIQLELCTPQITRAVMIACQGDTHQCPQSNGPSDPHIGGTITQGSPNVSFNSKALARHNDLASCKQQPNYIISHFDSITINGKAIAYQQANMQHGGYITSGQQQTLLKPLPLQSMAPHNQAITATNELQITCTNKKARHLIINFEKNQCITELQPQTTTLANLSTSALTHIFQIILD